MASRRPTTEMTVPPKMMSNKKTITRIPTSRTRVLEEEHTEDIEEDPMVTFDQALTPILDKDGLPEESGS